MFNWYVQTMILMITLSSIHIEIMKYISNEILALMTIKWSNSIVKWDRFALLIHFQMEESIRLALEGLLTWHHFMTLIWCNKGLLRAIDLDINWSLPNKELLRAIDLDLNWSLPTKRCCVSRILALTYN